MKTWHVYVGSRRVGSVDTEEHVTKAEVISQVGPVYYHPGLPVDVREAEEFDYPVCGFVKQFVRDP